MGCAELGDELWRKMSTSNLVREDVVRVETTSGVFIYYWIKSEGEGMTEIGLIKLIEEHLLQVWVKQSSIGNQGQQLIDRTI